MSILASPPSTVLSTRPSSSTGAEPRVALALAALWIVWGSTYLAMRIAVETLPPLSMAGARFLVAGTVVLGLARARGHALPTRRDWLVSLPIGALMFLVGNGLVVVAERTLPSSLAAAACATTPLVATAIGAMRGERPKGRELVGMVLGFAGVLLLAGGSLATSSGPLALVVLLAPIGWAFGSTIAREKGLTSFACAGVQMIAGGACMLTLGFLLGERFSTHVSLRSLAAWTHLVVFGSVVGYSAYVYLLRHARPAVALSYAYVNPVLAVALGATIGGERISWAMLGATALIAVGVASSIKARSTRVSSLEAIRAQSMSASDVHAD
jgi:drug/metabolite transporter (DMT)-like permease